MAMPRKMHQQTASCADFIVRTSPVLSHALRAGRITGNTEVSGKRIIKATELVEKESRGAASGCNCLRIEQRQIVCRELWFFAFVTRHLIVCSWRDCL